MKKLILFISILLLYGCSMVHHMAGTFDYVAVPQPFILHPSFSVYGEGAYGSWLKEKIEFALMRQNVTILMFDNNKQIVTETSGDRIEAAAEINSEAEASKEEGGKAAAKISSEAKVAGERVDIKTTTGLKSTVK